MTTPGVYLFHQIEQKVEINICSQMSHFHVPVLFVFKLKIF